MELHTCKKNVMNCPAIFYHDKTAPEDILRVFPDSKPLERSNGCISFKVSEAHLKKGLDLPLSQLIGFRQYMHYHVDAIKIALHTRMRKRVDAMELIIKQARRDEPESNIFKDKHGGTQIVEAQEKKRADEVFKFK
jgi:hypothetical protein